MGKRIIPIGVRSMFGYHTQAPLVILRVGDVAPQLVPAQARQIGHWLIEAAAAAEQDAAFLAFCKTLDLDARFAAGVLQQLRETRDKGKRDMEVDPS